MNQLETLLANFNLDTVVYISIAICIFLVFQLFNNTFAFLITKIFNYKIKDPKKIKKVGFYTPLKLFFSFLGLYFAILYLKPSAEVLELCNKALKIVCIALFANGLANSTKVDSPLFKKIHAKLNLSKDNTVISLFAKIFKFVIYIFAGMVIIGELGYDINGLVAGLGLVSLTISLAAQDTVKNLFGGIIIILDKPFAPGDWIETSNIEGVVEDITFRSTRIRTFKNSVVTVPNSVLSNIDIINWSKMNKRKINSDICVTYNTPLKNICNAVSKINLMLEMHPDVDKSDIFVKVSEMTSSGIKIMIQYYTTRINYDAYLSVKENITYRILQILDNEKVTISFPTQTIHIEK